MIRRPVRLALAAVLCTALLGCGGDLASPDPSSSATDGLGGSQDPDSAQDMLASMCNRSNPDDPCTSADKWGIVRPTGSAIAVTDRAQAMEVALSFNDDIVAAACTISLQVRIRVLGETDQVSTWREAVTSNAYAQQVALPWITGDWTGTALIEAELAGCTDVTSKSEEQRQVKLVLPSPDDSRVALKVVGDFPTLFEVVRDSGAPTWTAKGQVTAWVDSRVIGNADCAVDMVITPSASIPAKRIRFSATPVEFQRQQLAWEGATGAIPATALMTATIVAKSPACLTALDLPESTRADDPRLTASARIDTAVQDEFSEEAMAPDTTLPRTTTTLGRSTTTIAGTTIPGTSVPPSGSTTPSTTVGPPGTDSPTTSEPGTTAPGTTAPPDTTGDIRPPVVRSGVQRVYVRFVDIIPETASCITEDWDSGVKDYATVIDGLTMQTEPGIYTFTCSSAEDWAGNISLPVTFSYEITD